MIKRIDLVTVPVRDQKRALDFYTGKLGCRIVTDQPFTEKMRWIELKVGGGDTKLVLFTPDGQEDRVGSFASFTLMCDNVQKSYDELTAKGVEFVQAPKTEQWGTSSLFKDSEGNTILLSSK